jgi:hypothetical protein
MLGNSLAYRKYYYSGNHAILMGQMTYEKSTILLMTIVQMSIV